MDSSARVRVRRRLALIGAIVLVTAAWGAAPALAQKKHTGTVRLSAFEKVQVRELSKLVDAVVAQQISPPSDVTLTWRNHFLQAEGNAVYAPYTIGIDGTFASTPVAMYVRVIREGASTGGFDASVTTMTSWRNQMTANLATVDLKDLRNKNRPKDYSFEDAYFFEPSKDARVNRAFAVPPGEYDVYVAMREKPAKKELPKTAVLRQHVTVPDFSTKDLAVSSVIVADSFESTNEPVEISEQLMHPYSIGGTSIVPASTMQRAKNGELAVVFWIYHAGVGTDGKPDVEVDYNFHRLLEAGGESFFNGTTPQQFNAETLPGFNPATGREIIVGQGVPLASFPEGEYRLEIKILDKTSSAFLLRNVFFSVVGGS